MQNLTKDELLEKVKGHLSLSIASTLKIDPTHLATSMDAQNAVKRCLTFVMAIGYNTGLEGAVEDLCEMYGALSGGHIERAPIETEVQGCYNTFRSEVAAFTTMHEMNQINVVPLDIWYHVSALVDVDEAYFDDNNQ